MKLPPARIEAFLSSLDSNKDIRAVLLYGPDEGLINERNTFISSKITDVKDIFNLSELQYDAIKNDPALLADELAAMSFTGGRRLIRVKTISTSLEKAVSTIIEKASGDSFLLFLAGNLPPSSTLRKFFEAMDFATAIPCYVDDAGTIGKYINQKLQGKYTIDNDALRYMQQACSGNRQLVMSEIEKLEIYMGEKTHIDYDDALQSVGHTHDSSISDLCMAVMSCDGKAIETQFQLAINSGIAPLGIMRALIYYVMRLYQIRSCLDAGQPEKKAFASVRPPVFFKDIPLFKRHLQFWNKEALERLLTVLEKTEHDCKQTAMPVDIICRQLVTIIPFYRSAKKKTA